MLASGILGISLDVFSRLYDEGAGALVTKSLSAEPWDGYLNPTVVPLKNHGWLNAVGLSNPGAEYFANMLSDNVTIPIIPSLVGSVSSDFTFMIDKFKNCNITAYELNLSCPHVAKVGLDVGDDPDLVSEIIKTIKQHTSIPVFAKIGLGTRNYLDTVQAACDAGVDAITAINTIRSMVIDIDTQKPILSNKFGGLSGPPIKPIAIRCVYEITKRFNIPVIGCGGVTMWDDAIEFILAGASVVQIGSALAGPDWTGVFSSMNEGISQYMEQKGYDTVKEMVGLGH